MPVDIRSTTTRLILFGGLVAAGAVATAACGAGGAVVAAGGLAGAGALKDLLGALAGIASNVFATDAHAKMANRLADPDKLLRNHDLTKAVGDAIAAVLSAAADDARKAKHVSTADALKAMAGVVPGWWPAFVADRPERAQGSPTRGPGLTEKEVSVFFSVDSSKTQELRALNPEAWNLILQVVAERAHVALAGVDLSDVAKRLHERFPAALRETIKHDAVTGGKAYPALHLMLLGDTLGAIHDVGKDIGDHETADAGRHREVMAALAALRPAAQVACKNLASLLDDQYKQLNDDLVASVDLVLSELADAERRLTDAVRGDGEATREHIDGVAEKIVSKVKDALQAAQGPPPVAPIPEPRALHVYEPRDQEKDAAAAGMFRTDGTFGVAALIGMAGVGKTYLAELIAWEHRDRLPGGMLRLELQPGQNPDAKGLASDLCARYGVTAPAGMDPSVALMARLTHPMSMLLIENVDAHDQVAPVSAIVNALPGVPALVTGRCATLKTNAGWVVEELEPFDREKSDSLLDRELGDGASSLTDAGRKALFDDLGGVPLAISIAASYIRRPGQSASARLDAFLDAFHKRKADIADAPGSAQERNLRAAVMVSVAALLDAVGPEAVAGLARMAFGPAAGMGADLARTVSGLDDEAHTECCASAKELSLVRLREGDAGIEHVGFHPLVAEVLCAEGDEAAALDAMTDWFVALLPKGGDDQGVRWGRIQAELPALERWLGAVPEARLRQAERAGSMYAMLNGPFRWWAPLCERLIASGDADDRSNARWTLGQVQYRAGELEAALATAEAKRDEDAARGADREVALAAGQIADILQARGELDEALRIRREEQLPVYERLGDVRSRAVTMGKIADILYRRGELDEALRIRREEELPVYERLGDVRSRAVTMGKIADILQARGELDEALRIRREEELPVYERLGDVRSLLVGRVNLALTLARRGRKEDAPEALGLLVQALADARRLRIPEPGQIEGIMRQMGLDPDRPAP